MSRKGDRKKQDQLRSGALNARRRANARHSREPSRIQAEVNQIRSGKIRISDASEAAQEIYLYG